MNKKEYIEYHEAFAKKMVETTKAKNADYTGTTDDPFANFTNAQNLGITEIDRAILVRMSDKFTRIIGFVNKGTLEVKDEVIEDTLLDLASYSILLSAYIKSQKEM